MNVEKRWSGDGVKGAYVSGLFRGRGRAVGTIEADAVVALEPLTWGSGVHRVKGRNFHIHPDLYLFHFGMVDYESSREKVDDRSLNEAGWTGHLKRRSALFDIITGSEALEGDDFFAEARRRQSLRRPLYALNKPGMLKEKPVIKIPGRFRSIV